MGNNNGRAGRGGCLDEEDAKELATTEINAVRIS
jgi:hypothetical protein